MKIIFAQQDLPRSIFLAGPTPRDETTKSWRPEALEILKSLKFNGSVLVPEGPEFKPHGTYDAQIHWEWEALNLSTVAVFWVPRNIETLPGFITNIEFGYMVSSGKVVFGYPNSAPKMKYMDELGHRYGVDAHSTLRETLKAAVDKVARSFGT